MAEKDSEREIAVLREKEKLKIVQEEKVSQSIQYDSFHFTLCNINRAKWENVLIYDNKYILLQQKQN